MRSITTTLMDDSLNPHDPFPHLDPALHPPLPSDPHFFTPHPSYPAPAFAAPSSPAMDLQYILSPSILLDEQPQMISTPNALQISSQPVPSSSRSGGIPAAPPVIRRPGEHVHPNPDDAIISFDSRTRSFPKPSKPSAPSIADPYAEDFLRDMLGQEKWETFSTRLFERRLGGKAKGKGKGKSGEEDDPKAGASAIEFLVKVEIVKEILRQYVPHPYNPLKSLTHPYPPAPSGQVTLTRSTVLLLCGWSNTQFSYWARRSEAVSVLAEHDSRLHAVSVALERRLRGANQTSEDESDEGTSVTGKGLDVIVEDVKKRTGKSQFLRGKHSSLDPFGTTVAELNPHDADQGLGFVPPPAQYAMPTFQAERYSHGTLRILQTEGPPSLRPRPPPVSPPAPPKRRLRPLSPPRVPNAEPTLARPPYDVSESRGSSSSSGSQAAPTASPASTATSVSTSERAASSQNESPSLRTTRSSARKAAVAPDNTAHNFPVSDSRSEVESHAAGDKRKPSDENEESRKRSRPAGEDMSP